VLLERVEAENAVRLGQLELNRLIGLPLDAETRPAADADSVAGSVAPDPPPAPVTDRPELRALREQVLGREAQLRAARASRLPELDFTGRYLYARPNPYFFQEQDHLRGTWELGFYARSGHLAGRQSRSEGGRGPRPAGSGGARGPDTRERAAVDVARQQLEVRRAAEAVNVARQNVLEAEESFRVAGSSSARVRRCRRTCWTRSRRTGGAVRAEAGALADRDRAGGGPQRAGRYGDPARR
jgi:outer membrane protein TolC